MGKYDKEAKKILGRAAFTLLCTAASEDRIDEQKMRDISVKLHPEVGGNHRRRGGRSDDVEMRELLSDWYQLEMFEMTRESALGKLVDTLEDSTVNLRPQAKELKELIIKAKDNHDSPPVKSNHRTTDEVNLINT